MAAVFVFRFSAIRGALSIQSVAKNKNGTKRTKMGSHLRTEMQELEGKLLNVKM
jgi:hypothetical protein